MSISEIKTIIQIVLLILRYGKEIVGVVGEIVEEVKSWFKAANKPIDKMDTDTLVKMTAEVRPLLSSSKGKEVSQKAVAEAVSVLWKANSDTVKKLTTRRSGKTKGRG